MKQKLKEMEDRLNEGGLTLTVSELSKLSANMKKLNAPETLITIKRIIADGSLIWYEENSEVAELLKKYL